MIIKLNTYYKLIEKHDLLCSEFNYMYLYMFNYKILVFEILIFVPNHHPQHHKCR